MIFHKYQVFQNKARKEFIYYKVVKKLSETFFLIGYNIR
jgi:hypothetical protein